VLYPESESTLGSNLLVLKLNNCFKAHPASFQNPKNQQQLWGSLQRSPDPMMRRG